MLTEAEIQRNFRKMVTSETVDLETCDRAESLLDELRPESPLRHRLGTELDELRKIAGAGA